MKRVLLFSGTLLALFPLPSFARVPEMNVQTICKAKAIQAKLNQSPPDQSMEDCVRDEEAAKLQLGTLWASTPVSIQHRCQTDARSLGMTGYIDLLACTQLATDIEASKTNRGKQ
jgi:hypothetical protein